MGTFSLVALGVFVAGFPISWLVRRRGNNEAGAVISLVADIGVRLVAITVLFGAAAVTAERGGALLAVSVICAITGLMALALTVVRGIAVWLLMTGRLPDEE